MAEAHHNQEEGAAEAARRPVFGGADERGGGAAAAAGVLKDRFEIDFARRYPEFSTQGAEAVAARDRTTPDRPLYALVGDPRVPSRRDIRRSLQMDACPHMQSPVDVGVIALSDGDRRSVSVLDRPLGGPLMRLDTPAAAIPEIKLLRKILPQILDALEDLYHREFTYRKLRPDTIFRSAPESDDIVLAECFSEPPAASQPLLFEPVARARAHPHGRGPADESADMYALGMTLLMLSTGRYPGGNEGRAGLVAEREAKGTRRVLDIRAAPARLTSLLNGLLTDDAGQRWRIQEVRGWLNGIEPRPRYDVRNQSSWRIGFAGRTYTEIRGLAAAMAERPHEAALEYASAEFDRFLDQAIDDTRIADRIRQSIHTHERRQANAVAEETFVARVLAMLDARGPIRSRTLVFHADGIGPMLAKAFAEQDSEMLGTLHRFMREGVVAEALDAKIPHEDVSAALLLTMGDVPDHLRSSQAGFGLERCLYELNPSLPCQSPALIGSYVIHSADVLPALERTLQAGAPPSPLIDRHLAAFLMSRSDSRDAALLRLGRSESSPVEEERATLSILGNLHARYPGAQYVHVAEYLASHSNAMIEALSNVRTKERLKRDMARLARAGDIDALARATDYDRLMREDAEAFGQAVRQYRFNERELSKIHRGVTPQDLEVVQFGLSGAAVIGYLTLAATIAVMILPRIL